MYRPYAPEDFERLYAIEEACFLPPFRFGRRYMEHLVSSIDAATWIAEEDGWMVGFVVVEWGREAGKGIAYLQTIEVVQGMRGHGVGAELLRLSEGSALLAGARRIWLHVDAENESAIRLYQRHGYVFEGRQENYYPRGRAALIGVKGLG